MKNSKYFGQQIHQTKHGQIKTKLLVSKFISKTILNQHKKKSQNGNLTSNPKSYANQTILVRDHGFRGGSFDLTDKPHTQR